MTLQITIVWVLLLALNAVNGFSTFLGSTVRTNFYYLAGASNSRLEMALTPIGSFCPFRSKAAEAIDPKMDEIQSTSPDFATEMTRFQLDLQNGVTPEPERLRSVAAGIDQAVDQWRNIVTRLKISPDFQTKEYAKLTQAHLSNHGMSLESVGSMMRWQAGCMRAMADNTPPPMPPRDLDLSKMMDQAQQEEKASPSISAMAAAEQITSKPFDPEALENDVVKEEYEALCRDHSSLIEFGGKYDSFDPLGKIRFLDEIEKIEERWDVSFARFSLMGELNKEYMEQCTEFLLSMSMDEEEYRHLLKRAHQIMRADAEAERSRLGI